MEKLKIKLKQLMVDNGFQTWVKRIYFYDDEQLAKVGDWCVGLYHCEHCGETKGFAFHLKQWPDEVLPEAHNSWVEFIHQHAHGDGRPILSGKTVSPSQGK